MAEPTVIVEWEEKQFDPRHWVGTGTDGKMHEFRKRPTKVRREGRVVGYVADLHGSFRAIVVSENKFAAVQLDDLTIVQ